jgi:glyoxylase I family protein
MAVPFTVVGIDHIVLRATDPTKLERFYLDALGLRLERREGYWPSSLPATRWSTSCLPTKPGRLAAPSSTAGANLDHLCLRVEPFDGVAIAEHLAGQNVACGAEALRYGAEGSGPSIYLRDPEGNGVELKGPATD